MSVLIWDETKFVFGFDIEEQAKLVVQQCLVEEGFPVAAEINLTIVHQDEMQEINREQREIDQVTDVLSFPMLEFEEAGLFSEEQLRSNLNYDTDEIMLGDIIICCEKVEEQAKEYGHSMLREFSFLVAHSMFHLMGYDHMTPEEEKVMFLKQEKVLTDLEITRE